MIELLFNGERVPCPTVQDAVNHVRDARLNASHPMPHEYAVYRDGVLVTNHLFGGYEEL